MKSLTLLISAAVLVLSFGTALWGEEKNTPELPQDVSDFRHIHSLVVNDQDSPLFGVHHFYLNQTGWQTFSQGGPYPYPEGTVFLGAVYDVQADGKQYNEGTPRMYTLMRKNPAAKETGGWTFAAFDPKGKLIEQDVKTACFGCHQPMKESDFVFSRPLELRLPRP